MNYQDVKSTYIDIVKHNYKFQYLGDNCYIITSPAGSRHWFLNGKWHREDGPAIEYANGDKYWYLNDQRHREDGPAIEYANGNKYWYLNDKLHREAGPAVEWANGSKYWYLNGKQLTEEELDKRLVK